MSIMEEQLQDKVVPVQQRAQALDIRTPEDYAQAGEQLKGIKGLLGEIAGFFTPMREKAHQAWKAIIRAQDNVEAPLLQAEATIKRKMVRYNEEQERLRRQEELRLQLLAQEEEERRQAEEAAILEALGEEESAIAVREEIRVAPPVILQKSVPKVSGISMQTRWSAQVFDLMLLIKAVAAGKAPIQCLKADDTFLNRQATAMKAALQYPGVKAVPQSNISAGRR